MHRCFTLTLWVTFSWCCRHSAMYSTVRLFPSWHLRVLVWGPCITLSPVLSAVRSARTHCSVFVFKIVSLGYLNIVITLNKLFGNNSANLYNSLQNFTERDDGSDSVNFWQLWLKVGKMVEGYNACFMVHPSGQLAWNLNTVLESVWLSILYRKHSSSAHAKCTLLLAKSARTLTHFILWTHFTFFQGELYLIIPFH